MSTLAATGIPKLHLMLSEDSLFIKTNIDVVSIWNEVMHSENTGTKKLKNDESEFKMDPVYGSSK